MQLTPGSTENQRQSALCISYLFQFCASCSQSALAVSPSWNITWFAHNLLAPMNLWTHFIFNEYWWSENRNSKLLRSPAELHNCPEQNCGCYWFIYSIQLSYARHYLHLISWWNPKLYIRMLTLLQSLWSPFWWMLHRIASRPRSPLNFLLKMFYYI